MCVVAQLLWPIVVRSRLFLFISSQLSPHQSPRCWALSSSDLLVLRQQFLPVAAIQVHKAIAITCATSSSLHNNMSQHTNFTFCWLRWMFALQQAPLQLPGAV